LDSKLAKELASQPTDQATILPTVFSYGKATRKIFVNLKAQKGHITIHNKMLHLYIVIVFFIFTIIIFAFLKLNS